MATKEKAAPAGTGPLSTCDLIEAGILRPGARAFDLRCAGFDVATERRNEYDDRGRLHRRVARYHLLTGGVA
jgi:hypothetical protein